MTRSGTFSIILLLLISVVLVADDRFAEYAEFGQNQDLADGTYESVCNVFLFLKIILLFPAWIVTEFALPWTEDERERTMQIICTAVANTFFWDFMIGLWQRRRTTGTQDDHAASD